jgi:MFS family permease
MQGERGRFDVSTLFVLMASYFFEGLVLLFIVPSFVFMRGIFDAGSSETAKLFTFTAILSAYYLGEIVSPLYMGALCDWLGRRKTLLLCLSLIFFGFILLGIGVALGSLALVLIGRFIEGLGANVRPISLSALSDLCPSSKEKVKAFGFFSMVDGAMAGIYFLNLAFFVDPNIDLSVALFAESFPFFLAAFMIFMILVIVYIGFSETYAFRPERNWLSCLSGFGTVLKQPQIKRLYLLYFFFVLSYFGIIRLYRGYFYNFFEESFLPLPLTYLLFALGWVGSSGFLLPRLHLKIPLRKILFLSITIFLAFWIFFPLAPNAAIYTIALVIAAVCIGLIWPSILVLIAHKNPPQRQGKAQSIAQWLYSFSLLILPVTLSKYLYSYLPILQGGTILFLLICLGIVYSLPEHEIE